MLKILIESYSLNNNNNKHFLELVPRLAVEQALTVCTISNESSIKKKFFFYHVYQGFGQPYLLMFLGDVKLQNQISF
jgi:hypothetical protein